MCFLSGIPFVYDVSIFVQYLDMSTFQFFLVGHIYFADLDGGDLVNNVCSTYRCNISRNCIFTYSINNCLSSCIFRKFCKLVSPIAIYSYFLVAYFFSVCKKSDCNTFRTFFNLITVVPGFISFYRKHLWCMAVRDCIFCSALCYCLRVSFRYAHFIYCVADRCSGCVLRKSCPCICPAVCRIKCYCFSAGLSVCFQLHADACRADSVLVVTVFPDFSYAYACLFC